MAHNKGLLRISALMLAIASSTMLLAGCAQMALELVMSAAYKPTPQRMDEGEANQWTFTQSIEVVFAGLLGVVEREGRQIVDQDPVRHSITVSYPFSLLQNNWGGTFKVSCTVSEARDGSKVTTVHVFGSKTDPHSRVRKIGDAIVKDLVLQLSQS